jgi:hypothetical protein
MIASGAVNRIMRKLSCPAIRHDPEPMRIRVLSAVSVAVCGLAASACGLNVTSPDLFLLTRSGQGGTVTLRVSDDGTLHCNGGPKKTLPDKVLLQARDLANALDKDAKAGLDIARTPDSVYSYTIKLQDGTIRFPDTAAATHHELSQVELFAVQTIQGPCGKAPG